MKQEYINQITKEIKKHEDTRGFFSVEDDNFVIFKAKQDDMPDCFDQFDLAFRINEIAETIYLSVEYSEAFDRIILKVIELPF
jgi:hypothetical protein